MGRKTFQGIANRQNDTRSAPSIRRDLLDADAQTPRQTRETDMTVCTSSSIRTMTVGSGISPDLLTPWRGYALAKRATFTGARGLADGFRRNAYRRWGIAPRPEDVL